MRLCRISRMWSKSHKFKHNKSIMHLLRGLLFLIFVNTCVLFGPACVVKCSSQEDSCSGLLDGGWPVTAFGHMICVCLMLYLADFDEARRSPREKCSVHSSAYTCKVSVIDVIATLCLQRNNTTLHLPPDLTPELSVFAPFAICDESCFIY